ncbi:MAG: hypothetical protein ACXWC9_00160 [Pseudobdellovibrionaceae bacterium]
MQILKMTFVVWMLAASNAWATSLTVKPHEIPTLENFTAFVRNQTAEASVSQIKMIKSNLEKRIVFSMVENSNSFLHQLNRPSVLRLLSEADGVSILQRVDSMMTTAAQELGEKANNELQAKSFETQTIALNRISQIRIIEKKRDDLAALVAGKRNDGNFNAVFDYMIQSHFRRADGLNQGSVLPKDVKLHLYGRNNPNQTAFKTLKKMTLEVLTASNKGPLQNIRQLKITGTAELIPPFKPTLHTWEVEAYYFLRNSNRLPSSTKSPTKPQASSKN